MVPVKLVGVVQAEVAVQQLVEVVVGVGCRRQRQYPDWPDT